MYIGLIILFSINTARHYLWVFNHYVKRHTFMLDQSWVWKWLQYPWSLCEWGHWPPTTGAHLMLGRGRDGGRLAQAYTGSCLGREQVGVKRCHYHNRIHWPSVVPAWQSDFTSCRRELSGTVCVLKTKLIVLIALSCAMAGLGWCWCLCPVLLRLIVSNVR